MPTKSFHNFRNISPSLRKTYRAHSNQYNLKKAVSFVNPNPEIEHACEVKKSDFLADRMFLCYFIHDFCIYFCTHWIYFWYNYVKCNLYVFVYVFDILYLMQCSSNIFKCDLKGSTKKWKFHSVIDYPHVVPKPSVKHKWKY